MTSFSYSSSDASEVEISTLYKAFAPFISIKVSALAFSVRFFFYKIEWIRKFLNSTILLARIYGFMEPISKLCYNSHLHLHHSYVIKSSNYYNLKIFFVEQISWGECLLMSNLGLSIAWRNLSKWTMSVQTKSKELSRMHLTVFYAH